MNSSSVIIRGTEEYFDWFKSYADVADLLRELIPNKQSRILMLGCGNSRLSEDVCAAFFGLLIY